MRSVRANGLGILMVLKKVCGRAAKYVSWKDTRRWSENGMLEPEALKGQKLLLQLFLYPWRAQHGIRQQRYGGGKGHWGERSAK